MKHFATDTCHPESGSCRIEGSRRESLKVTSVDARVMPGRELMNNPTRFDRSSSRAQARDLAHNR